MRCTIFFIILLTSSAFARFERHDIAPFPKGYQVAVADLNGDGKLDVIAVSTDRSRSDWYENPTWKERPVARLDRPVDLAPYDVDADGRPEIAMVSGFYFGDGNRGGEIQWLDQPEKDGEMWTVKPIAVDPVVHRIQWGDLDGDGKKELVHAPIFGRGSRANIDTKPVHFWAFCLPADPAAEKWTPWTIDETLTVLHGLRVKDIDGDGRDEVLGASFEGIHRYDFEGRGEDGRWKKTEISKGEPPENEKPGATRGASEVDYGRLGSGRAFYASVEPWHGDKVVVYVETDSGSLARMIIDDTILGGHAVVVADFDNDGSDELLVGWRRGEGGLALYDPAQNGKVWIKATIDSGIKIEDALATDLNGDGKLDIVAIARVSDQLVWYENRK